MIRACLVAASGLMACAVSPPAVPKSAPVALDAPADASPRVALVLGGGGARGFAHVGVLRVLAREKIPIHLIVGTSVGSLIGALYAADPNVFDLEWKAFQIEQADLFDFSFFSARSGPVKGEAVQQFLRDNIEVRRIEDFAIPFVATATDLNTGELVSFREGDVVPAVRASVSIPGVFTPAQVGSRTLVDGGLVANVAVDVARDAGADVVIVSNITSSVVAHDVDDVVDIILQSIDIMMSRMADYELRNADVVITPDVGSVGTLDFSQKKRCMEEGIRAAEAQLPALRAAIERPTRAALD